jgi:hypothetical protein
MIGNHIFTCQIDHTELSIPEKPIGLVLGYPDGQMPGIIKEMFYALRDQAGRCCAIKGGYRLLPSEMFLWDKEMVAINGKPLHVGRIIAEQLRGADFAAVFACTLGFDLEQWAKESMASGEAVKGYIIDAIGSEMTERAMDKIEAILSEQVAVKGLRITSRFSPGYCGWPVNDQHCLFSLLPANFCGISLTPTALMVPIKSISGIIGVGSRVRRMAYPCQICEMTDCIRRAIYQ